MSFLPTWFTPNQQTPEAPSYLILRCLSRSRFAALRLAARRCCGLLWRAGETASAAGLKILQFPVVFPCPSREAGANLNMEPMGPLVGVMSGVTWCTRLRGIAA